MCKKVYYKNEIIFHHIHLEITEFGDPKYDQSPNIKANNFVYFSEFIWTVNCHRTIPPELYIYMEKFLNCIRKHIVTPNATSRMKSAEERTLAMIIVLHIISQRSRKGKYFGCYFNPLPFVFFFKRTLASYLLFHSQED